MFTKAPDQDKARNRLNYAVKAKANKGDAASLRAEKYGKESFEIGNLHYYSQLQFQISMYY
jgi:hypothetical protein